MSEQETQEEKGYTEKEIRELAESGDMEFINKLATGQIKQIPTELARVSPEPVNIPPVPIVPVAENVASVPTLTPIIEPVAPTIVPQDDGSTLYAEAMSAKEKKFTEEFAAQKKEYEEKLKALSIPVPVPVAPIVPVVPVVSVKRLEETEDDVVLASIYSQNNRADIDSLNSRVGKAISPEEAEAIKADIKKTNTRFDEYERKEKIKDDETDLKNYRKNLFADVTEFIKDKPHLSLNKGVKEKYEEHSYLRTRLGEYLHTEDNKVLNKSLYGIAFSESDFYSNMKTNLKAIGIDIPEDTGTYLKLAEIVDLKNGKEYDSVTGEVKVIADNNGRPICQRSIGDAYKLSNYSQTIVEARKDQVDAIQQSLAQKNNAAVLLPSGVVTDENTDKAMTEDEARQIFLRPESDFANNPALNKKLKEAYGVIGLE